MALSGLTNAEKIWNYFKSIGMSEYGIAGLVGNLDCESALNPRNVQDSYECNIGYNDESYTAAVDNGTYTNFIHDGIGYGLFQATWWSRKKALLDYAITNGASIGDLEMQISFIHKELKESFPSVFVALMNASSVLQASNAMLLQYERPADMGASAQSRRAATAQKYYDKFSNKTMEMKTSMGYCTVAKGSKTKLSEHFNSYEFDCHGYGCCSQTIINEKLVEYLEKIRIHFGTPITITSGYRCPVHNAKPTVGGSTGSRHTKGDAADIVVANHSPAEVAKYAESIGIKGIGLYETSADGHFVHIDTRTSKSFWYGQAQAYRSTFGGSSGSIPAPTQTGKPNDSGLIMYGQTGAAVKDLQEKLITLGFSCGNCGADGSFGLGTMLAVKAFQKAAGFSEKDQDGIAGTMTLSALEKELAEKSGAKTYTVTANLLNVRSGAGLNHKIVATVVKGSTLVITEEKDGWGKINSGWVSLQYCKLK